MKPCFPLLITVLGTHGHLPFYVQCTYTQPHFIHTIPHPIPTPTYIHIYTHAHMHTKVIRGEAMHRDMPDEATESAPGVSESDAQTSVVVEQQQQPRPRVEPLPEHIRKRIVEDGSMECPLCTFPYHIHHTVSLLHGNLAVVNIVSSL